MVVALVAPTTIKNGSQHHKSETDFSAFIAAARRKDRSPEGKIESAKKSSEAHYETHGRYFYLTVEIILGDKAFEDLEDLEQLDDPALILPEGADIQLIRQEILQERAVHGLYTMPPVVVQIPQQLFPATIPLNGLYGGQDVQIISPATVFPANLALGSANMEVSLSDSTTRVSPTDSSPQDQSMLDFLKDPDEVLEPDDGEQGDLENGLEEGQGQENDLFGLTDGTVNGWMDDYKFEVQDLSFDSQDMFYKGDVVEEEG